MFKIIFVSLLSFSILSADWFENLYREIFDISCLEIDDVPFEENWKSFIDNSDEAIKVFQKMENSDDSWFFNSKERLRKDFNSLLDDILLLFSNDKKVVLCLNEMRKDSRRILELKDEILKIKEQNIEKNEAELKQKLAVKFKEIEKLNVKINKIRKSILDNLKKLGFNLSEEELKALLVRIDSKDIVKMAVIFDISKKITAKLEELMRSNSENITVAKRYYGMNLILSEIAVYINQKYIDEIDLSYIPKLNKIKNNVNKLITETKNLIAKSSTDYERKIYQSNLKSQMITLKTANLYIQNLQKQKEQIEIAKKKALKNLKLTVNSYKTVKLGANLLHLIKSTQKSFSKIMDLQFPELVPFENKQIELEYQKITNQIEGLEE
jgi:hypothetical protein